MESSNVSIRGQAAHVVREIGGQLGIRNGVACLSTVFAALLVPFPNTNVLGDRFSVGVALKVGLHRGMSIGPYLSRGRIRLLVVAVP